MNRFVQQFEKSFKLAEQRKWDKIYVLVDIHETCVKPTWSENLYSEFYDSCKEALQLMTENENVCLILWSSGFPEMNKKYSSYFGENGIKFDYINENPECPSNSYADFGMKFYFNVGLDDKMGFIPELDWIDLYIYFLNKKTFMELKK